MTTATLEKGAAAIQKDGWWIIRSGAPSSLQQFTGERRIVAAKRRPHHRCFSMTRYQRNTPHGNGCEKTKCKIKIVKVKREKREKRKAPPPTSQQPRKKRRTPPWGVVANLQLKFAFDTKNKSPSNHNRLPQKPYALPSSQLIIIIVKYSSQGAGLPRVQTLKG